MNCEFELNCNELCGIELNCAALNDTIEQLSDSNIDEGGVTKV